MSSLLPVILFMLLAQVGTPGPDIVLVHPRGPDEVTRTFSGTCNSDNFIISVYVSAEKPEQQLRSIRVNGKEMSKMERQSLLSRLPANAAVTDAKIRYCLFNPSLALVQITFVSRSTRGLGMGLLEFRLSGNGTISQIQVS